MSPQDGLCQKYETMSTFIEVMQKKLWPLFFQTRCTNSGTEFMTDLYQTVQDISQMLTLFRE